MGKPFAARFPHTSELWQPRWVFRRVIWLIYLVGQSVIMVVLFKMDFRSRSLSAVAIIIASAIAVTLLAYIPLRINRGRPHRKALFLAAYYALAMLMYAATFLAAALVAPFNPLTVLWWAVTIIPVIIVVPVAHLYGTRRDGDIIWCAACGYEQAPTVPAEASKVCPECGGQWREPGGTRQGKLVYPKRSILMLLGVGLLGYPLMILATQSIAVQRAATFTGTRIVGFNTMIDALKAEQRWPYKTVDLLVGLPMTDDQFDALCVLITERGEAERYGEGFSYDASSLAAQLLTDPALSEDRFTRLVEAISRNYAIANATPPPGRVRQFIVHIGPARGIEHLSIAGGQIQIQRWVLPFAHPCVDAQTVELRHGHGTAPLSWPLHAPIDGAYAHITFTPCDVNPATTPSITVPIMLVAAPWTTHPHQSPPAPIINPDGSISPPPGALWTRTVNLTIPVTRAD